MSSDSAPSSQSAPEPVGGEALGAHDALPPSSTPPVSQQPAPPAPTAPPPDPAGVQPRPISPLTLALVVVVVVGAVLVLVTRGQSHPEVMPVAVARGNLAAYSLLGPDDWKVVSKTSVTDPRTIVVPKGATLILRPIRQGAILRAADVLELTGIVMPAVPVAIDIATQHRALVSHTSPGESLTLYLARTSGAPSVHAIALSGRNRDGSLVVAVAQSDVHILARALGSEGVLLERPIR